MNNWNFTGNLGKTAEQRFTAEGKSIVSFSVAVKSGYGDRSSTTWANCAMFGKQGEAVLQYLNKGQLVGVSGEVTLRPWNDKEGAEKFRLDVRVNDLTLLGKSDAQPAQQVPQKAKEAAGGFNDFESDIPFINVGRNIAGHSHWG